ncbi:MAG TPA: phosphoribosyltransferase [Dongiaceae bacterium]|jgi:putative phosphoribosyl transferase|nr:phosphoribosyltransferase [Dongiaceae bacterium]
MLFKDRADAGRQLAEQLALRTLKEPVVLALPRGGVPVGDAIAARLSAPLDIVLVRKIGVPWQPELALGAIADGDEPELVVNEAIRDELGLTESYLREEAAKQLREIERRRLAYLGGRAPIPVRGKTAIVVDDGIATGATMRAALRATRRRQPGSIVLAVPVSPAETIASLRNEVDDVLCLHTPIDFGGVGQFYAHFPQVDDATVTALLQRRAPRGGTSEHG